MIPDDFYRAYMRYTVSQRLFEDTCRQLRDFSGDVKRRDALVDETLRLAADVSDGAGETEGTIGDLLEILQTEGAQDPELMEQLGLISNSLKEDRARADSYAGFVTYRRMNGRTRMPRRPQIANPFVFPEEVHEEVPEIIVPVPEEQIPSEDDENCDPIAETVVISPEEPVIDEDPEEEDDCDPIAESVVISPEEPEDVEEPEDEEETAPEPPDFPLIESSRFQDHGEEKNVPSDLPDALARESEEIAARERERFTLAASEIPEDEEPPTPLKKKTSTKKSISPKRKTTGEDE